jgi:hypothetical protein
LASQSKLASKPRHDTSSYRRDSGTSRTSLNAQENHLRQLQIVDDRRSIPSELPSASNLAPGTDLTTSPKHLSKRANPTFHPWDGLGKQEPHSSKTLFPSWDLPSSIRSPDHLVLCSFPRDGAVASLFQGFPLFLPRRLG